MSSASSQCMGKAIHDRFTAAPSATKDDNLDRRDLSGDRAAARNQLRNRLGALVAELKLLHPPDDSRWLAFGMTPPAERRAALKAARDAKKAAAESHGNSAGQGGGESEGTASRSETTAPEKGNGNGNGAKGAELSAPESSHFGLGRPVEGFAFFRGGLFVRMEHGGIPG